MTIDHLLAVMAPPVNPTEIPGPRAWKAVEGRLGMPLPIDYKEFIEIYGSGKIADFLWIFNPFSINENLNLEKQIENQARVLAELQLYGESIPYRLFPERGGVLPFGITDNGDVLFWLTAGAPDDWVVVVNEARAPNWELYNFSMSGFLAAVLQRQVLCGIFPKDFPGFSIGFKANF